MAPRRTRSLISARYKPKTTNYNFWFACTGGLRYFYIDAKSTSIMEILDQLAPFTVFSQYRKMPIGTLTPVGIYLRLRERFANSTLFVNADGHAGYSYIGFDAVARFECDGNHIKILYPDGITRQTTISKKASLADQLERFRTCFQFGKQRFSFQAGGLFTQTAISQNALPGTVHQAFRYVLVVHHQTSELHLIEHTYSPGNPASQTKTNGLNLIEYALSGQNTPAYPFRSVASPQGLTPTVAV